jgi:hypothetical protein
LDAPPIRFLVYKQRMADTDKIIKLSSELKRKTRQLAVIRAFETQKEKGKHKALSHYTSQLESAQRKCDSDIKLIDQKLSVRLAKIDAEIEALKLERQQLEAKGDQQKAVAESKPQYWENMIEGELKREGDGRDKTKQEMMLEAEIDDIRKSLAFYQKGTETFLAPIPRRHQLVSPEPRNEVVNTTPRNEVVSTAPKPKPTLQVKSNIEQDERKIALNTQVSDKIKECMDKYSAQRSQTTEDTDKLFLLQEEQTQIASINAWYQGECAILEGRELEEKLSSGSSSSSSSRYSESDVESEHYSESEC